MNFPGNLGVGTPYVGMIKPTAATSWPSSAAGVGAIFAVDYGPWKAEYFASPHSFNLR
jgi:hypothetical protein